MTISQEYKEKVIQALLAQRDKFGGSDADYAKSKGMSAAIYSRIAKGEREKLLSDAAWIRLGRELDVQLYENNWKVARTQVYISIQNSLYTAQGLSKSMILVDDCGIGKTFCAKHIIKEMKNAFYVDCSQGKTKQQFIRLLAKTIGVDHTGRYIDVKNDLKYYLTTLEKPLICLDEAGDLDYQAFLEIKELWNGTENACAWYMMGADGLRAKIERGKNAKKVGYAEIFSRFSDSYIKLVPNGAQPRTDFYRTLVTSVAMAQLDDKTLCSKVAVKCINNNAGLRYLKTLIELHSNQ